MNNLIAQFISMLTALRANFGFVLIIVGSLYAIHLINWLLGYRLNYLGIYPRKLFGLPGIVFSPFLHSNFNHLFFNSFPLVILISLALLNGMHAFLCASIIIIVLGGFGTWLVGRRGIHIGASGVVMGYWGYLLFYAYQSPTIVSVALAIVCIYYLGSLVFSLFPMEMKSSWEAHVCGFLAGLAAAYICYHQPGTFPLLSQLDIANIIPHKII
jgi:membrane associated rhomboid family serine protease